MKVTLTREHEISAEALIKAISLKSDACFAAMSVARAFSGARPDDVWYLAETYTLPDLLAKADGLSVDLSDVTASVTKVPLSKCLRYRHARGELTDAELRQKWGLLQSGDANEEDL